MKVFIVIILLTIAFFIVNFNPDLRFSQKIENQNIFLRHNFSQPYNFDSLIENISSTLKKSKLYKDEYKFKIYLTESHKEFCFYSLFHCNERYYFNPFINAIYISPVVIENQKLKFIKADKYDVVDEIKKAAVYSLILQSRELLSYLTIRNWRKNGYAEYIASNTPFYTESDLCHPVNEKDYYDYENRMCVKYIIEEMRLSEDELFNGNYLYEGILDDVKLRYCKK